MQTPPPDVPGRPKDWREQIKADLAAQLAAGATLYGVRSDGTYSARTKDGDRVLRRPSRKSTRHGRSVPSAMPMPYMVADPNGCGKSTLTRTAWLRDPDIIDPDVIARANASGNPDRPHREVPVIIGTRWWTAEPLPGWAETAIDRISSLGR